MSAGVRMLPRKTRDKSAKGEPKVTKRVRSPKSRSADIRSRLWETKTLPKLWLTRKMGALGAERATR